MKYPAAKQPKEIVIELLLAKIFTLLITSRITSSMFKMCSSFTTGSMCTYKLAAFYTFEFWHLVTEFLCSLN